MRGRKNRASVKKSVGRLDALSRHPRTWPCPLRLSLPPPLRVPLLLNHLLHRGGRTGVGTEGAGGGRTGAGTEGAGGGRTGAGTEGAGGTWPTAAGGRGGAGKPRRPRKRHVTETRNLAPCCPRTAIPAPRTCYHQRCVPSMPTPCISSMPIRQSPPIQRISPMPISMPIPKWRGAIGIPTGVLKGRPRLPCLCVLHPRPPSFPARPCVFRSLYPLPFFLAMNECFWKCDRWLAR